MKIKNFTGLTAFITGASSGIGLATAKLLASKGANILVLDIAPCPLADIEHCRLFAEQKVLYKQLDVTQREMVERVLPAVVAEFGPPDILINSAGISYPQEFWNTSYETWDRIIKVNLYGTWNTTSVLVPYLKEKKGYIVNLSSIAGFIGVFSMTVYSASKFGVIGFSEALRSELKPLGVTVSVLCPPDVDTPLLEKENVIKPEEAKAVSSAANVMQPEAVAAALVKGMSKGEFLIMPSADAKLTFLAKRLAPGLVEWFMDNEIRKVQQRREKR